MDPETALARTGGAARRETLLELGVSRRSLERAVREVRISRPMLGTYALIGADRSAVLAAAFRARTTCITALREWGVATLRSAPRGVHLGLPADRGVTARDPRWRAGVVLHRAEWPTGGEEADAVAVLRDASRCLDRAGLMVAADHLLRARRLMRAELQTVSPSLTTWLRDVADPGAASPPETLARLALVDDGYDVHTQVHFRGVGAVDLVVNDAAVVETDGRDYHSDPVQFLADRRRDRALVTLGYRVLRYTGAEVLADPTLVAREVRAIIGPARAALGA